MVDTLTWGGEFSASALEAEYRAGCMPEYINHARLTYGLATLINLAFYANDWFSPPGLQFYVGMGARTVIVITSIFCYCYLVKVSNFRQIEVISVMWMVVVSMPCAALVTSHAESALFITLILPIIFFLTLPMSFRAVCIFSTLASYGVLAGYVFSAELSETSCGLGLGMLTLNVVLGLVLRQSNRLRRAEWSSTRALRTLANTDSLTGLANRACFFSLAAVEIKRTQRYARPLAVVMIDIDFFKYINDNHGHMIGDQALQAFAKLCRSMVRDQDVIARLGGEEFALLLPETEPRDAVALTDRLRLETPNIVVDGLVIAMTISAGISEVFPEEMTVDAALSRADKALYVAKRSGRNRACQFACAGSD